MTVSLNEIYHACHKADLHRHLDGQVRLETMHELIHQQKIVPVNPITKTPYWTVDTLPTMETLAEIVYCGEHTTDLNMYLRSFDVSVACMQTKENLERIIFEAIEDAHNDNIKVVEFRYAPAFHTRMGLTPEEVVSIVCNKAKQVEENQFPDIHVRFISCILKFDSQETATRISQNVINWGKKSDGPGTLNAFDLAGPENINEINFYKTQLEKVRESGQHITIHAGEAAGPNTIRQAIENNTTRIGHGVRLQEDQSVWNLVRDSGALLEMCPTSNVHTKVVGIKTDLSNYPLRRYMQSGVHVTIATDNPTVSSCTLTGEYIALVNAIDLSPVEALICMDNAFAYCFIKNTEFKNKIRAEAWSNNVKTLSQLDPKVEEKAIALKKTLGWN